MKRFNGRVWFVISRNEIRGDSANQKLVFSVPFETLRVVHQILKDGMICERCA